jgi:acetyl-CoA C-acetyltransferase
MRIPARAARLPPAWRSASGLGRPTAETAPEPDRDPVHAPSLLGVSPRADGAALLLLASASACQRLGLQPCARWRAGSMTGGAPERPMAAASLAAQDALTRAGLTHASQLAAIELHDAFAVQALATAQALGIAPSQLNRHGGGLVRGHPIGASGAIALVRLLADLSRHAARGATGLALIAAAGGLGAGVVVERV